MKEEYLAIYEQAEGNWSAYLPDLPGCVATGATKEECARNLSLALAAHLKGMKEDGLPIPSPSQFGTVQAA